MLIAKPLFEASAVVEGFGWNPVFENSEVAFYQMNGLMLGTWQKKMLEEDMRRKLERSGVFALAHNVSSEGEVDALLEKLSSAGGLPKIGFQSYGEIAQQGSRSY